MPKTTSRGPKRSKRETARILSSTRRKKLISEQKDKLSEEDVKSAEAAIADCKKALEEGDADRVNSAVETLTQVSHKIAESMYSQAGSPPGDGEEPGPESAGAENQDDNVIDAEYVDVDEGDKKE